MVKISRRNNGCISDDIPWFLNMDCSQIGSEHQDQRYSDKVIDERERKYVSWVMVHTVSLPEHDNIFSNLMLIMDLNYCVISC